MFNPINYIDFCKYLLILNNPEYANVLSFQSWTKRLKVSPALKISSAHITLSCILARLPLKAVVVSQN